MSFFKKHKNEIFSPYAPLTPEQKNPDLTGLTVVTYQIRVEPWKTGGYVAIPQKSLLFPGAEWPEVKYFRTDEDGLGMITRRFYADTAVEALSKAREFLREHKASQAAQLEYEARRRAESYTVEFK